MEEELLHFDVLDFKGRRIICTELQWANHIASDRNHAFMIDCEDEIIETLQSPDNGLRYIDRKDPRRKRDYYKLSRSRDYYTKVVVEYDNDECSGVGRVHTAYMPDQMTAGERPEFYNG
jgi:hypothetical protein